MTNEYKEPINKSIRFTINSRLNNPFTEFTLDYTYSEDPPNLEMNNQVSFTVNDPYSPDELRLLRAYIDEDEEVETPGNKITTIQGSDIGFYLAKQSFELECNVGGTPEINTAPALLDSILHNTGIMIARGQPSMIPLEMPNQYGSPNWYCGVWKTKSDALDWLFRQYQRGRGMNKIRWYIDMSGHLRWFEHQSRETAIPLFNDDNRIHKLTIRRDATNIVNDIRGTGGEKGEIKVHLQDADSITQFGLQPGGTISDSQLTTEAQVIQRLTEELSLRSKEIYTVTMEMKHYVDYAPGMRFTFPEKNKISNETFTMIGYNLTGDPAKATATLELTTDESLINNPNTFEAIKAVIKDAMDDGKTQLGQVVAKDESTKTVLVETYHGGQRLVSRYA